jgi:hypothetical protein
MAAPGGISCIGHDSVGALGVKCRLTTRSEQDGTGSSLSAGASTRGIRRFLFPARHPMRGFWLSIFPSPTCHPEYPRDLLFPPPRLSSHVADPSSRFFARVGILTRDFPLPGLSSRAPEGSAVSSSPTVIPHCGPFHSASLHSVIPNATGRFFFPFAPERRVGLCARTAAPSRAFAAMNLLLYFSGFVAASLARQLVSRRVPHPWFLWGGGFDSSALVSASLHAVIPST